MKKLLSVVLAVSMLLSLCTAFPASAEEAIDNTTSSQGAIYSKGKVWFDLNGNSKLFINAESEEFTNRADKTDYVPGLDYSALVTSPTGNFDTDKNALYNSGERINSFFPYTVNKGTTPTYGTKVITDFKTENDNTYWTIDNVDYLVRPTEKVIKLVAGVNPGNITDETLKARFSTLAETTVDVKDGYYNKIGFLADMHGTYNRYVAVTLVYEDEERTTEVKVSSTSALSADYNFSTGSLFFERLSDTTTSYWTADWHTFKPYEVTADSSKKLISVKLAATKKYGDGSTESSYLYPTRIISLWGEEQSLAEKITALNTLNTAGITTTDSYNAVKEAVEDIEKYLVNYSVSLTDEQKDVYDTAKANMTAYETALAQEKAYAQTKKWFDFEGNSKLFMLYNSEEYTSRTTAIDYLPGLDYAGVAKNITGTFDTDRTAVINFGANNADRFAMFPYTLDNGTTPPATATASTIADFTTKDGNVYWNIDGNDYLIRPNKKIVKVAMSVGTSGIGDADLRAKYDTLGGYTIDIPDAKYEKIGLLAGIFSTAWSRKPIITLIYEDEEKQQEITVAGQAAANNFKQGSLYFHPMDSTTLSTNQYYWHTFKPHEITTDSSKKLTAIKIEPAGSTSYLYPVYVLSVWGDEISLEKKITDLAELNKTGVTESISYEKVKDAVDTIDNELAEKGFTASILKTEDKDIYDAARKNLDTYEVTLKTANDALVIKSDLAFEGNSKLFMNAESSVYADRINYKDYAPGLDYGSHTTTPFADFDTDYATAVKMVNTDGFGVFPYTINKGTVAANAETIPDFSKGTDDNIYWNIDNVDYLIKPEEKAIKLVAGTSLYNLQDAETKAKYDSLNGVTIDVADGKYESVGFLAGVYSQSYTRNLYVTLVYETGEEIKTEYPVTGRSSYTNNFATGGVLYQPLSSNTDLTSATTSSSQYWHSFTPVTVPADNTKTLVSIKVEPDSSGTKPTYRYPLYVISAWKTHTIKNALSTITANTTKADAKVILSAVNATLAANEITVDDLTDETKAKYQLAKACANSLEVISADFADSKVTVSYTTSVDTDAKVIVAEYEDEEEALFKKVTILPVTFTANETSYEAAHTATGAKVKVFVWKDMINFFPYH